MMQPFPHKCREGTDSNMFTDSAMTQPFPRKCWEGNDDAAVSAFSLWNVKPGSGRLVGTNKSSFVWFVVWGWSLESRSTTTNGCGDDRKWHTAELLRNYASNVNGIARHNIQRHTITQRKTVRHHTPLLRSWSSLVIWCTCPFPLGIRHHGRCIASWAKFSSCVVPAGENTIQHDVTYLA